MRGFRGLVGAVVVGTLAAVAADAADPPAKDAGIEVVVTDPAGKEVKLSGAKLVVGVRRLGWLADPAGATDDAKKGPLAFELREPNSTTYAKGVVTLVPAASVEAVKYDADKQAVEVAVKGLAAPLAGTTQFKGINVLDVDGSAGGVPASFTSNGPAKGSKKLKLKAVAFPGAKPLPARGGGPAWDVVIDHPKANNPTLTVRNLKALYALPGGVEQLADALPVRKGDPLPLTGKGPPPKRLEVVAVDPNTHLAAFEVQTDGGEKVVVVPLAKDGDPRAGMLVGLVGEVDAGWKLFPLHAVKSLSPAKP